MSNVNLLCFPGIVQRGDRQRDTARGRALRRSPRRDCSVGRGGRGARARGGARTRRLRALPRRLPRHARYVHGSTQCWLVLYACVYLYNKQ